MTRAQIEAEIAELKAKNEAATGWGAAVGARSERIEGLEQALRAMAPDQSSAGSEHAVWSRPNLVNLMTAVSKSHLDLTEQELFGKIADTMIKHLTAPAQPALKPFGYLRIWDHTDISTDFFFEKPDDLVGAKIVAVYAPQDSATANLARATTAPVLIATHASEGLPSSDAAGAGAVQHLSADSRLDEQLTAQLEGLAIGLDQRGEKSAAHIIRTALKRFTLTEPQPVGEPSPCAYTGYVAQGDENVLVRIWGFGRPDASVKDVRLLYSFPPPVAGEPNARAIADAYSDWAWEKEGTPVGLMLPNESARAGFFAGAKWACSVSRPEHS